METKNEAFRPSRTALENDLLSLIPISSALGVKVEVASCEKIILSAPLSNNINHKKTVFGGSLHAVATLACWSLLHVNLQERFQEAPQVVIASSEVAYLAPVTRDFEATCSRPDTADWERFLKIFQKREKARLKLHATIFQDHRLCVDFSGIFVAIQERP